MRHAVFAALVAAFTVSSYQVVAAVPAIPQDPERQEQLNRDRLDWNRRTLVDAYEKVGKKDPRWDDPARRALEAAARHISDPLAGTAAGYESYEAAKQAVEAGCDDPMILYLFACMAFGRNSAGRAEDDRRFTTAALAMKKSDYPFFRRYVALYKAGQAKALVAGNSPKVRAEAEQLLSDALALMAQSVQQDDLGPEPERYQYDLIETAQGYYALLSGDKKDAYLRVQHALAEAMVKCLALKPLMLSVHGQRFVDTAWEARGRGYAKTVTDEGWKQFKERLNAARDSLQTAWDLNPRDGKIATRMMWVVLGLQLGRAEMEKWFERAMKADPNNRDACLAMIEYLEPKWHGSMEEMMAFGRACGATKNWRSGIPLLLPDSYRRAAFYVDEAKRKDFLASPAVYSEIAKLFTEYLQQRPNDSR
jgi:hypothetical protein